MEYAKVAVVSIYEVFFQGFKKDRNLIKSFVYC